MRQALVQRRLRVLVLFWFLRGAERTIASHVQGSREEREREREREGERGISRLDLILEKKEANSSLDSWQHPSLWPVQEQLDTIDPVPFYLP